MQVSGHNQRALRDSNQHLQNNDKRFKEVKSVDRVLL